MIRLSLCLLLISTSALATNLPCPQTGRTHAEAIQSRIAQIKQQIMKEILDIRVANGKIVPPRDENGNH